MAATKKLVVTGATGKQGGALISALLSKPTHAFEIYAVTRNPKSSGAQKLSSKPNVKIIQGDFDNADAIFKQVDQPWGLFSMTNNMAGEKLEEQQGKALTKAAVDAGVQHIVFTATDRGGDGVSDNTPTSVPHFKSKYNVEKDIISKAKERKSGAGKPLTWTFLRPVAFFDNLSKDFFGKTFVTMLRQNGSDRKLQMISTADIGKIAAEAFLNASSPEYRNTAISLAGDSISPNEMARIFKDQTGQDIPETYSFIGTLLKWFVSDLGMMFRWFVTDDFGVDLQALRKRYPFLRDFRGWLREESAWRQQ